MPGKCMFNILWLDKTEYKDWLQQCQQSKFKAKCSLCLKIIDLSNMGEAALKAHMTGKKHKELIENKVNSALLSKFVEKSAVKDICVEESTSKCESSTLRDSSVEKFVAKSDVQKAEILWALKCIKSHFSYRSSDDSGKLFTAMFPDSKIASKFGCNEKKLAYICCFGLAPHFKKILVKTFDEADFFTIMFDETLNSKRQEKQLDLHIRFWHKDLNEVCTRYYSSVFMGHSTAEDILDALLKSTSELKLNKIIQVSMDGPIVNWVFYEKLQKEMKSNYGTEVLNIGSCGLHILNNAFKRGASITSWQIYSFLSSLYYLFKDCPARRDDFIRIGGEKKFPVKFVCHRWLESVPSAERALEILPDLHKFIDKVDNGVLKMSNPPKSFYIVRDSLKDHLMPAKISFFLSVAKFLQPFLSLYQADKPLLPFLATDVLNLIKECLSTYNLIKGKIIRDFTIIKLCKFDFTDESNYVPISEISAGFVTNKLVKEIKKEKKVTEKDILTFNSECRKFVLTMIDNLMLKMPTNYALIRNLVCLDPRVMAKSDTACVTKMQKILEVLSDLQKLDPDCCERVLQQYRTFLNCEMKQNISEFSNYDVNKMRLDTFLHNYLSKDSYIDLHKVIKLLLILSHGQASVERGFSVNRNIEVENLKEHSYISQKIICDHISFCGGILNVKINKDLKESVSAARQRYMNYLEEQKTNTLKLQLSRKRKEAEIELSSLKTKMRKTEQDISELEKNADNFAAEGELLKNLQKFIKSNELRKLAKEKKEEVAKIKAEIDEKIVELKN